MLPASAPPAQVLVLDLEVTATAARIAVARTLREAGLSVDLYTGAGRLRAQMKYANAGGYPWVVMLGEDEVAAGRITLKNLESGDQIQVTAAAACDHILGASG